jgi:hypothetical protein
MDHEKVGIPLGRSEGSFKVNDNKTAKVLKIVGLATLIGAICLGLATVVYAVGGAALRTGNFSGVVILMIIALAAWGLNTVCRLRKENQNE